MIKVTGKPEQSSEEFSTEIKEALTSTVGLKTDNIDLLVIPYLSKMAVKKLSSKVLSLEGTLLPNGKYKVRYLALVGLTENPEIAAKKLASVVNKYVSAFNIKGQLGTFIKYDLSPFNNKNIMTDPLQSVYLAYIAVSPASAKVIDVLIKNKLDPFKVGKKA